MARIGRPKHRRTGRTPRRYVKRRRMAKRKLLRPKISYSKGNGIPNRLVMKDVYHDNLNFSTAAPGYDASVKYQSSLYDPNLGGVGTGTLNYAEFKLLYKRYRVYAMKVSYKIVNYSSSVLRAATVFDSSSDTNTEDPAAIGTWPHAKSVVIGPNGAGSVKTLTIYRKVKSIFDRKDLRDDLVFQSLSGANPALVMINHLALQSGDALALNCYVQPRVTYYCEWFDRVRPDYDN